MRTLQEFQSDVLTPLRKERDEKMMATYDHISSLKSQYQREGNERQEEKIAFMKEQKEALKAFQKQQAFDLGIFNAKLATRKTNSFNLFSNGMARIKQERRTINETYQDKIGLAFARYNKERMAAGEAPVFYDRMDSEKMAKEKDNGKYQTEPDAAHSIG